MHALATLTNVPSPFRSMHGGCLSVWRTSMVISPGAFALGKSQQKHVYRRGRAKPPVSTSLQSAKQDASAGGAVDHASHTILHESRVICYEMGRAVPSSHGKLQAERYSSHTFSATYRALDAGPPLYNGANGSLEPRRQQAWSELPIVSASLTQYTRAWLVNEKASFFYSLWSSNHLGAFQEILPDCPAGWGRTPRY